jgi:hypothetical protein
VGFLFNKVAMEQVFLANYSNSASYSSIICGGHNSSFEADVPRSQYPTPTTVKKNLVVMVVKKRGMKDHSLQQKRKMNSFVK